MEPAATASQNQYVSCPSCGQRQHCYDPKGSAYFACSACLCFFRHAADPAVIGRFDPDEAFIPTPAIGSRGELDGRTYTVTGCISKTDTDFEVYWKEYMLYNEADQSYAVLIEMSGSWSLSWLAERQDHKVVQTNYTHPEYAIVERHPYRTFPLFTSYTFHVLYAAGGFDTNILADANALQVDEYIDPPDMYVAETRQGSTTWYQGRYLRTGDVMGAFNISPNEVLAQTKHKTGKLQLLPEHWPLIRNFSVAMTGIFLLALLLMSTFRDDKQLAQGTFSKEATSSSWYWGEVIDAGAIQVEGPAALRFQFSSNVKNSWLELKVRLVHQQKGWKYEFAKSMEFYSGVESGESWAEGNAETEAFLSSVPSGTYQVVLYPVWDNQEPVLINMTVTQNPPMYANTFICLLAILIYPGVLLIRKSFLEHNNPAS